MNTSSQPAVITPSVVGLALLAAALVYIGATDKKVPLLSNIHVDIALVVIIGVTICSQSGIGRIATTGQWLHPLSIIAYVLGALILLVALSAFAGWKLPYIQNETQSLLAIAILMSLKIVNAIVHSLMA